MPQLRLRNARLAPGSDAIGSSFANAVRVMAWMQPRMLDFELRPSSPLRTLLQLLHWRDLQHLVCTERAHRAYHQARALLQYGKLKLTLEEANPDIDHCVICLLRLGSLRGSCVMCSTSDICPSCVFPVEQAATENLPFPAFHRLRDGNWDERDPLKQGDVLCLVCHPTGANAGQACKVRQFLSFCDLMDSMQGHRRWFSPPPRGAA
jgi:hypothetical protein